MGNSESTKKKQVKAAPLLSEQRLRRKMQFDPKEILLLHKSNEAQLRSARNFRDALTTKANGSAVVAYFVNIADGCEIPIGRAWLEKLNNVVLICLTPEAIEDFRKIILEKRFADENGHLHSKVFSVSFGESLTSVWPAKGLQKGSSDLRDFHFGFSDFENLRPQDFEKSLKISSLLAAMKGTDTMENFYK